jgi:hypothetical protein
MVMKAASEPQQKDLRFLPRRSSAGWIDRTKAFFDPIFDPANQKHRPGQPSTLPAQRSRIPPSDEVPRFQVSPPFWRRRVID